MRVQYTARLVGGPRDGEEFAMTMPTPTIHCPVMETYNAKLLENPAVPLGVPSFKRAIYDQAGQDGDVVIYKYVKTESPPMYCGYCHGRHKDEVELMECQTHAKEIDLEEPFWLPEAVSGYRGFSLTEENGIWQLKGVKQIWYGSDPGPAVCNPTAAPLTSKRHDAPKTACMCGYYMMKEYDDLGVWDVEAYVEGWGDVIEHERGYRVERVRLVSIRPGRGTRDLTKPIVRMIAKRYGVEYDDGHW